MNPEKLELEIGQPKSYELDISKIKTLEDLTLVLVTIGFRFNQRFLELNPQISPFIKETTDE